MAESLISLYKGTKSVIKALTESVDGAFYFSTDSQDLYRGDGANPKKMTGFIFADTKPANPIPEKPYLIAGILYIYIDDAWITISGGGSSASSFIDLNDTPDTYEGHGLKTVVVKEDETGLEFITTYKNIDGGRADEVYQSEDIFDSGGA